MRRPLRDLCVRLVFPYTMRVSRCRPLLSWIGIAAIGFLMAAPVRSLLAEGSRPSGDLAWRAADSKVSARIDGWTLDRLLETIAARTRWQIFVDPDARHRVNAKFSDLGPGEALRRLLGPLNFVLVPAADARSAPKLYVFRNSRAAATQRVAAPPDTGQRGRRLDDELILRRKPGSSEDIDDLAARLGGKVIGRSDELGAYRLKFDSAEAAEAARRHLAGEDGTRSLDSNYVVDRPDPAAAELAAAMAGLNLKAKPVAPGEGVVVAVVDTGVQGEAAGIQDFLLPEVSIAGKAALPSEELAHGTSMAATLLHSLSRLAGESDGTTVRVLPVDVYGNRPDATSFDIALGIYAAMRSGASIVNLSLGGDEPNPFIRDLIQSGREQGVVFLAAAGNAPVTAPTFPAAYPEVIAVTALNRQGEIAAYANYGEFVDVGAPGASYVTFRGQPYVVVGTSPATASASAMAAWVAASTGKRGAELEAEIRRAIAVNPQDLSP